MSTPTQQPQFTSAADIPLSNPRNVQAVYSNVLGLTATATDVTLIFNELGLGFDAGKQQQTQEVRALVTLSYPVLSGLIQSLQQVLSMRSEMQAEQKKIRETKAATAVGE